MINYKVLISKEHVLLLSDEEIKDGDVFYNTKTNCLFNAGTHIDAILNKYDMKVIGGNGKGTLAGVNEESLDKALAEKEERLLYELANSHTVKLEEMWSSPSFIKGLKTSQTLKAGNKYSEDDMRIAWQFCAKQTFEIAKGINVGVVSFEQYIKSLEKPVIYDCEIDTEIDYAYARFDEQQKLPTAYKPKLTNNEFTITKIK